MQIKTTARHFELTPALKDHVEERLNRLRSTPFRSWRRT